MQTHYVFVDYENTQPGNLGLINGSSQHFKIKVFLGRHQNMIPLNLARAMHALGEDAEYVQLDSSRRNAIDFNIAFQLGELAVQHPEARFSILSNDPGFNAIVDSLKSKGIVCARYPDIENLMERSEPASAASDQPQEDRIVAMEAPNKLQGVPSKKTLVQAIR
ncbi:MAG TPA: PIN domain-containing protein [Methylophilaceae bacterium]|nr:PIN domain-containing protein [Methylophilaceae bacterium]